MTESTKIQLPNITKTLNDADIRLHLLVLANSSGFQNAALEQAKKWYEWIKEAPQKESW